MAVDRLAGRNASRQERASLMLQMTSPLPFEEGEDDDVNMSLEGLLLAAEGAMLVGLCYFYRDRARENKGRRRRRRSQENDGEKMEKDVGWTLCCGDLGPEDPLRYAPCQYKGL
mmetsp:Transcript_88883/g.194772  ORF Transcript_88883/g.194772 Transcript_88883/m.194772 type:complete len:114 (+) Transcript_88883:42-383(+)